MELLVPKANHWNRISKMDDTMFTDSYGGTGTAVNTDRSKAYIMDYESNKDEWYVLITVPICDPTELMYSPPEEGDDRLNDEQYMHRLNEYQGGMLDHVGGLELLPINGEGVEILYKGYTGIECHDTETGHKQIQMWLVDKLISIKEMCV